MAEGAVDAPPASESEGPQRFSGEITVGSKIVDYLSSGLYENPAACLRELIHNSYDADARQVNVFVKPDADRIIIEDNGTGMSRADFERHFRKISESYKRETTDVTASGRPIIGKIGIGFIAANEICDVMEIYSTTAGSHELLHVVIDFKKMRDDPGARRREEGVLEKADYIGEVTADAQREEQFTHVFLKSVRGRARQMLASASRPRAESARSLYGLSTDSVAAILSDPEIRSWSDFDEYSETMLEVGLHVPVRYHDEWIPKPLKRQVRPFEERVEKLDFQVSYDGTDLRKPIVLRPPDRKKSFVAKFACDRPEVTAAGYFYVQHGGIRPQDLNGVLIRIRNAAIDGYRPDFLGFPSTEGTVFQKWISGEIWVDDKLEDALNIDRKTLRPTHPAFVALQEELHAFLSGLMKEARARLYQAGNQERRRERASDTVQSLGQFVAKEIAPYNEQAASEVMAQWRRARQDPSVQRRLLKRYDVEDLYRIVVDVAKSILRPAEFGRFIKELTRRLGN